MTFRAPRACEVADVSYRQLDYWCRLGLVVPHVQAKGSGSQRMFSERDVQVLWAIGRIAKLGVVPGDDVHGLLAQLDRWGGWLVIDTDGLAHHEWDRNELATYPACVVVDLDRCPLGAFPQEARDDLPAVP